MVLPRVTHTTRELILSVSPLLDNQYDSEGFSLSPEESESGSDTEDYVSMHAYRGISNTLPPPLDVDE